MRSMRLFPPQEKVTRETNLRAAQSQGKHGDRVEIRKIETLAELPPYLDWPGVQQICRIERQRTINGKTTLEIVCAITSLCRREASAERLLRISRQHWQIENKLHYVRDVVLGEDACQVRSGSAPQLLAGVRNLVIGVLARAGARNKAAALRRYAAKPTEALALLLRPPIEN
jgi:predicted transposase YbfD/YdcC